MYTIAIKYNDDTMHPAKNPLLRNIELDAAEFHMNKLWNSGAPGGFYDPLWAGVAILDADGNIYSEMEW
jgi:hypothetical protein